MQEELFDRYERGFVIETEEFSNWRQGIVAFITDLARLTFSIEERARELSGAVELNHATYYSNDELIKGIASFLETGSRQS